MIPRTVIVKVNCSLSVDDIISDSYKEYLQREGFSDPEIKNKIAEAVRLSLWDLIPNNKVRIEFDD